MVPLKLFFDKSMYIKCFSLVISLGICPEKLFWQRFSNANPLKAPMPEGSEPFKELFERSTNERFEVCTGRTNKSIKVELFASELGRGRVPAKLFPDRFR
ncbi:Os03g0320850 [Oryza sativa Japonica Group]|uniref:Os03g0320850 protein n=1 Tax=Oryza sativa subsp. japonica TaxID=39947 RepID=A0A0P0VWT5_ORYSJ|nr:hypothetical protein EE612_017097 [Oryza sativa]BAS83935.1 Os03g0320850 [Oryza sativa Japonica Group]